MSNPASSYVGNYSWGVGASAVISLLESRNKKRYLMATQQGKPILDEELAEAEYRIFELIRRTNEHNIGSGSLGQDSFKIIQSATTASNFTITGGTADDPAILFVNGYPLFLFGNIEYNQQDATGALTDDDYTKTLIPGISVPSSNRIDSVYVDTYLAEVSSELGSEYQDTTLKDVVLNLQTANRFRIVQDILVNEGSTSIPTDGPDANGIYHCYYKLAEIQRYTGNANILTADITDSRTIVSSLKELSNGNGNLHVYDATVDHDLTVNGTVTIVNTTHTNTDSLTVTNNNAGNEALVVNKTNTGDAMQINKSGTGNALSIITGNVGIGTTAAVTEGLALYHKRLNILGTNSQVILSGETSGAAELYTTNSTALNIGTNGTAGAVCITNAGVVGINTTGPTGAGVSLDVNGLIKMRTGAGTAGWILKCDAAGIGSWSNPNTLADGKWTINGNDLYNVNTGNVGVGTSAAPTQKFIVQAGASNGIAVQNTSSVIRAQLGLDSALSGQLILKDTSNNSNIILSCDSSTTNYLNGGSLGIATLSGSVGVGTDPDVSYKLRVYGKSYFSGIASATLITATNLSGTTLDVTNTGSSAAILALNSGSGATIKAESTNGSSANCVEANINATTPSGGYLFQGIADSVQVFSVDYAGNITSSGSFSPASVTADYMAVNTTIGSYRFEVNGSSYFVGTGSSTHMQVTSSGPTLIVSNTGGNVTLRAYSDSTTNANCVEANISVTASNGYLFKGITDGSTVFSVDYAGNITNSGTFNPSGVETNNVAVGTTIGSYRLEVSGTSYFSGSSSSILTQMVSSSGPTLVAQNNGSNTTIRAESSNASTANCIEANITVAASGGYLFRGTTNGSPVFLVDYSGDVSCVNVAATQVSTTGGIAAGTTVGSYRFEVNGTSYFSGSTSGTLSQMVNNSAGTTFVATNNSSGTTIRAYSNSSTAANCVEANITAAASSGYLFKGITNSGTVFTVDYSGDVSCVNIGASQLSTTGGIAAGTTVGGYRFEVNGTSYFSGSTSSVLTTMYNGSSGPTLVVQNGSSGTTLRAESSSSSGANCVEANITASASGGYLYKGIMNGSPLFTVDYAGNVSSSGNIDCTSGTLSAANVYSSGGAGIGTTVGSYQLHAYKAGVGSGAYYCVVGEVTTAAGNCFMGYNGGAVFRVDGNGQIYSTASTTISQPADVAEWTRVQDDLDSYDEGTIVMQSIDEDSIVTIANDAESIYGVVTSRATFLGGLTDITDEERKQLIDMTDNQIESTFNAKKVAMVGHIKVKVKGKINRGQRLTLSDVPGVARAALTTSEKIMSFAIARESYNYDDIGLIEIRLL